MKTNKSIAVVGLGNRGQNLLQYAILPACKDFDVKVAAVYDLYEDRTAAGAKIVSDACGNVPIEAKSYKEILENSEIDGVIVSSGWEAHVDLAVAAMKAGKYVGFEVGGAYCVEDCWRLVNTYEETGVPCMMLENCCYGKRELMVLNMVRKGIFGDIVHCAGGYHHDLRGPEALGGDSIRHYRMRNYLNRNCENYPTHELGPIAKVLNINNGNRMVSLSSQASCAKGLHAYIQKNMEQYGHLADAEFAQGDVVTTVIKCAKGQTIVLTLDTTLPRAYSRGFTVRGTEGSYFEDTDMVFQDGIHNQYDSKPREIWGNAIEYEEEYLHPLWKDYNTTDGHGGMDFHVISAFLEAMTSGKRTPIDAYDAAAYMAITALSEESILKGGAVVTIPDFTRGKWYMRDDIADLKYNLDQIK